MLAAPNTRDSLVDVNQQRVRIVEFENAGHWVHHDRLDAFVDTVRSFIA